MSWSANEEALLKVLTPKQKREYLKEVDRLEEEDCKRRVEERERRQRSKEKCCASTAKVYLVIYIIFGLSLAIGICGEYLTSGDQAYYSEFRSVGFMGIFFTTFIGMFVFLGIMY